MENWEKVSEEIAYNGYRKVYRKHFRLPDGRDVDYETVGSGEIVCMVPITTDNKVILAEQFRCGPEKILKELPGGGLEKGETPEQAALRELEEETGYTGEAQFVTTSPADGYSSAIRHHLVIKNCNKISEPIADPDNIPATVILMPIEEFREHLRSGQLTDITTGYLGLDFLGLL
jgi:ADP-ribose pyrophosphatase